MTNSTAAQATVTYLHYSASVTAICIQDTVFVPSPHYNDCGQTLCGALIGSTAVAASGPATCRGCKRVAAERGQSLAVSR
jgi:hypothetical protein